jgi:ATP/maltotriose-dependent transcriptional regulator MalT
MLAVAGSTPDKARAKALHALGRIAEIQDDVPRMVGALEESLSVYRQVGDLVGVAHCSNSLGAVLVKRGNVDRAAKLFAESLTISHASANRSGMAWSLYGLGHVAQARGQAEHAIARYAEGLELLCRGGDQMGMAAGLNFLGAVRQSQGDYARAAACFEQSLALIRASGDRSHLPGSLLRLAALLIDVDEVGRAATLLAECLTLSHAMAIPLYVANCLLASGRLAARMDRPEQAARLSAAGEALLERRRASLPLAHRGSYARTVAGMRQPDQERDSSTPPPHGLFSRTMADARQRRGEEAFAAALAVGRAAPADDMVAEALTLLASVAPAGPTGRARLVYPDHLTAREVEVLRLLATGRSNREIAEALVVSVRTAEHHIASIYAKIGARRRADAVAYALRHDLLPPEPPLRETTHPAAGTPLRKIGSQNP